MTLQQIQILNPGDDLQAALSNAQDWGVVNLTPIQHGGPIYRVNRPLIGAGQSHLTVQGVGARDGARIEVGTSFLGPIMYTGPQTRGLPLGAALAEGPGGSWKLSEGTDYWTNLRDALDVDGLTEFTWECFLRIDTPGYESDRRFVFSASNNLGAGLAGDPAFELYQMAGMLFATLCTAGGFLRLHTPPITVGRVYHLALTYDGHTARLWQDGQCVTAENTTGPIRMAPWADILLGSRSHAWPESALNEYSISGAIDGLRFSKVCRYHSEFTAPTAKPNCDVDTLLLLNFDESWGMMTVGKVGTGIKAYLWLRDSSAGWELAGVEHRNMAFYCGGGSSGPVYVNCKSSVFERLSCWNAEAGFYWWQNCYDSVFNDILASGGAPRDRYGICLSHAAFDMCCGRLETAGFAVGVLLNEFAGSIRHVTTYLGQRSKFGLLAARCTDGPVWIGTFAASDEMTPPPDDLVAASGADGVTSLTFEAFSPQVARSPRPLLRVYGGGSVMLLNPHARVHPAAPCVVDVAVQPIEGIVRLGGVQTGGSVPWGL